MNYGVIRFVVGWTLMLEGALMVPSAAVAVIYGEDVFWDFAAAIALCIICGLLAKMKRPAKREFFAREGCVSVALSWVALSVMGSLPFLFSGAISDPIDALFETVSGFTTTGASILPEVESLPRSILFWRSFTHWIGGMGVLVFVLMVLPVAEGRAMHLMRAESPGPMVGKLVPKIKGTAKILYGLYFFLTLVEIILLLAGGMNLFDSVCHTFATAGTGGFSTMNANIAAYDSAYIDGVITVFMILFGMNFNFFFFLALGKIGQALKMEEVRWYLAIIAVSTAIITLDIRRLYPSLIKAFRYASFQVGSIITTTGFVTANYDLWPELSKIVLVLLMCLGACAGSTGGGLKVSRFIILVKSSFQEIRRMLHPRSVQVVHLDGKALDEETVHGTMVYFSLYMLLTCLFIALVSLDGFDFVTTVSSVLTCMNNVGPGLGDVVGAVGNFSALSGFSKFVLSISMLVGRLEIFPMLMLFSPSVWKPKRRRD